MRHVSDAAFLLDASPDQSWHLAGFGPECARKACLSESWLHKILGHDLDDEVLDMAFALDVQATRYEVRELARQYPMIQRWSVESRYEQTGTRSDVDARHLVNQAETLTYLVASDLWLDGRIEGVR